MYCFLLYYYRENIITYNYYVTCQAKANLVRTYDFTRFSIFLSVSIVGNNKDFCSQIVKIVEIIF